MESKRARAPKSPLPLNLRPLAGGYFFLLADFLAAGFLALDFCCFDLADLLAIMLLVFWSLTPLRHVSFPAEEPSMAAGAAPVNHRGEVSGAELCQKGLGFSRRLAAFLPSSCLYQSCGHWHPVLSRLIRWVARYYSCDHWHRGRCCCCWIPKRFSVYALLRLDRSPYGCPMLSPSTPCGQTHHEIQSGCLARRRCPWFVRCCHGMSLSGCQRWLLSPPCGLRRLSKWFEHPVWISWRRYGSGRLCRKQPPSSCPLPKPGRRSLRPPAEL
jgi:hypothetical protein